MTTKQCLMAVDELKEKECRSFTLDSGRFGQEIFVVCFEGGLYAYRNACPHTGGPLDWMPNQFLNLDQTLIQCSTHHALFQVQDGVCVQGPCSGQQLTAIPLTVSDGKVCVILEGE